MKSKILFMALLSVLLTSCSNTENKEQNNTDTKTTTNTKTISRDGKDYYPRQDITVLMLTGIDQTGPVKSSQSYNNTPGNN